jgi:RHS repeat-associated protein
VYNDGGYLTRRIDRRGLVREFRYDTLGRNTAEIWYDTAADAEMDANRQNTLNFTYDALGRMLSAGDQFASYVYAYDRLGRMTSSDAAIAGLVPTVTLTNAYDAAGRRTQVAATIGGNADFVTDYAYDQLGRTTSIRQYASPTSVLPIADKRVDFTYDFASQPVTLTRYADLSANQLVTATDYLFDQAGRLTGMTHSKGASIFADYDWTFDEANRMTRFESLIDGVADYTNDDTGQLTAAEYTAGAGLPTAPPDEQYVYDENGNRLNNGYTVGPNNQLISDGAHTYTYDEEGNRTSRTHIATGEVTEYHWDHRNRLTRVTTRATANGPLTTDIHYAYDFGQRWIRKTLDTNGDGTIEESRIFVHDNGQIVLDFQKTGTGDASNGDLSHRYLWGQHVDQLLADETVDTAVAADVAWTLTDHLNTVRDLVAYDPATDTTSLIKHITYGAFGNVTTDSAPGIDSLFLFTARPYDPDTGLQNNLNRWYDLSTGRWMTEDPIGFEAEDVNLYRYVFNDSTTRTDPLGLVDVPADGWRYTRCWALRESLRFEEYVVFGMTLGASVEGWLCECCHEGGAVETAYGVGVDIDFEFGTGLGFAVETFGFKLGGVIKGPAFYEKLRLAELAKRCSGAAEFTFPQQEIGVDFKLEGTFGKLVGITGYLGVKGGVKAETLSVGKDAWGYFVRNSILASMYASWHITMHLGLTSFEVEVPLYNKVEAIRASRFYFADLLRGD